MALSTQPYKGARDFYPEDKRLQKYMFQKISTACERFGYLEYDAPILEPTELYLSKGNEEIIQEQTYTFKDRGDRSVTLRTEMTPTVSRMVAARRQELPYPVRWYSIPQCWRYERMQRGRGREFYQLNVDVFGVNGIEADHEIIQVANSVLVAFGAKPSMYAIKINSRKLVDMFLKQNLGLDETQAMTLIRLIDRMQKIEKTAFIGQVDAIMSPSQREANATERLNAFLQTKSIEELPEEIKASPAAVDITRLMDLLAKSKVTNAEFDPTLMRGFDYYTDIIFEAFDLHPDNNRAVLGGGRYSGLVSVFGVEQLEAVGFAMGDIPLLNFLQSHELLPKLNTETDVYAVLIGDVYEKALPAITDLRNMGVNVAVDSTGRKPDKQLKSAVKNDITYALFIGEKELADQQFVIKNLHTQVEETHGLERIVSIVKDSREK